MQFEGVANFKFINTDGYSKERLTPQGNINSTQKKSITENAKNHANTASHHPNYQYRTKLT